MRNLQRKLALWYDDLSLCRMDGVSAMRNYKLSARLYRLMKRQDNDKEPYKRAAKELAGIVPAVFSAILGWRPAAGRGGRPFAGLHPLSDAAKR